MSAQTNTTGAVGIHDDQAASGAWRTLVILTILYWFGTLDRQIAALLIPDIKADLGLSDFQVSLIQGLAFGLLYMLMSPLAGWLVDRFSRRMILFGSVLGWSFSAMASGISNTFGTLFGARAGVGGFESALNPTSYSLLSDLFPPKKLALPMSIYVLGGNFGSGMSFLAGGAIIAFVAASPSISLPFVGELAGWQMAFLITGAPGLLLAPLIWFARDPRKVTTTVKKDETTFAQLWQHVRSHFRFYILHHLGFGIVMSLIVGLQSWNASYLSRAFGWELSKIGYILGSTQLLAAVAGLIFHGWMVDRMFAKGRHDAHLLYFLVMMVLALPCGAIAYTASTPMVMLIFYNLTYFLVMSFASIGPAALQIATPSRLRGKASASYMVVITIMGTILGPVFVASLTDFVFSEAEIGKSMAVFAAVSCILAALAFAFGRGPMRRAVASQMEG